MNPTSSNPIATSGGTATSTKPWWREREVFLLLVLVAGAYLLRIGDVSMRGEEPRRAQVAFEILDRGDWIVPREQGAPFLSRPPLQNWLIAVSTIACRSRDAWAVRLPSVLAMFFVTLLLYGYARTRLSRLGALASAACFATMAEMFTTGSQSETEAVFIALIAGSLLWWHWGYAARWSSLSMWTGSYVLVALAFLTKGPQPPVYFLGSVFVYLVLMRDWRRLFEPAHFVGATVGALIVFAWVLACVDRVGYDTMRSIVMSDTATRFGSWPLDVLIGHLMRFPLEVLACTAPWSLLLVPYLNPAFRRSLGSGPGFLAGFNGVCLLVAFPTCWIPPGAQTRYFSPLYPCLALLIGIVVERCADPAAIPSLRRGWRLFARFVAAAAAIFGLAALAAPFVVGRHPTLWPLAEPIRVALTFAASAGLLAWILHEARNGGETAVRRGVIALACFMALMFAGYWTNVKIRKSEDQAGAIAELKAGPLAGKTLVSLDHIDALFAFYYGKLIESRPVSANPDELADENVCFCFDNGIDRQITLPFAWERVAIVPMERNRQPSLERWVEIGRCTRTNATLTSHQR